MGQNLCHGLFGEASRLRATVSRRPAALEVAKGNRSDPQGRRPAIVHALDLLTDDIPGPFDVIYFSSCTFIRPGRIRMCFAAQGGPGRWRPSRDSRCLPARQGGTVSRRSHSVCRVHAALHRGRNTYTVGETSAWLKAEGFDSVRPVKMKKGKEDWEGGILEAAVLRGRSKGTAPEHDQQQIRAPAECTEDDLETRFVQPSEERHERGQIDSQSNGAIDHASHGGPSPSQHHTAGENERNQHEKEPPQDVSR